MKYINLVGCGAISEFVYVPVLRLLNDVQIRCIDREIGNAGRLAKEFVNASVHETWVEDPDLTVVATPPSSHFALIARALETGACFCEKPICETDEEVVALRDLSRKNRGKLSVNQLRRGFPTIAWLREVRLAKRFGALKKIVAREGTKFEWSSKSGFYLTPKLGAKGVLQDRGSHVIDEVLFVSGAKDITLTSVDFDSASYQEGLCSFVGRLGDVSIDVTLSWHHKLANTLRFEFELATIEVESFAPCSFRVQSCTDPQFSFPKLGGNNDFAEHARNFAASELHALLEGTTTFDVSCALDAISIINQIYSRKK